MWSFLAHVNGVTPMVGLDIYEHAFVFVTKQLSPPENQQTFDIIPAAKNIYIITVSPLSPLGRGRSALRAQQQILASKHHVELASLKRVEPPHHCIYPFCQ